MAQKKLGKYDLPHSDVADRAREQIQGFKQARADHLLNIVRLEAQPESESRDAAIKQQREAIALIESGIDATEAHISSLDR